MGSESKQSLAQSFVAHLAQERLADLPAPEELEAILAGLCADASASFPDLPLNAEKFLPFVAQRVPDQGSLEDALAKLKIQDLFLVCACLCGVSEAVRVFEGDYLPEVELAVQRMENAATLADDVKQVLAQKLLLPQGEKSAKLASYSGRGGLRSWLRVTAVRAALDLMRRERGKKKRHYDDKKLVDLAAPDEDQEIQYLKRLYRKEFKTAFAQSLAQLTSRERNILRLQLMDGLSLDQVGVVYHVHRATVARWNAKIREQLLAETRKILLGKLKIDRTEFESIMRLIQSQFDVSIRRHLAAETILPQGTDKKEG